MFNEPVVEYILKTLKEFVNMEHASEENKKDIKMSEIIFKIMLGFKDDRENYFKMCNVWNDSEKHRLPFYLALWHATITLDLEENMEDLFDSKDNLTDRTYLKMNNFYADIKKLRDYINEKYDIKVTYTKEAFTT